MFSFLLFLHFQSCPSFFPVPLFHRFSLFSLSLGDDTKWPTRVDVSLNPNTINWSWIDPLLKVHWHDSKQASICTVDVGWSGGAKVSCILCHRGVQLILAYSWARPAILVAGKGRGGMFLFLLFLHFHSCSSFFPVPLFHLFDYLFYHSSPFLWEMTQNDPQGLTCR